MGMFGSRGGLRHIVPVKSAKETVSLEKNLNTADDVTWCPGGDDALAEPFVDLRPPATREQASDNLSASDNQEFNSTRCN